jgi:mannosyltransferase
LSPPPVSRIIDASGFVVVECLRFEPDRSDFAEPGITPQGLVERLMQRLQCWRAPLVSPMLLASFALLLRLHDLTRKPLWYDEILSLNRARLPLIDLIADALTHKHYPTYFLLLRPFASAHLHEWALRFPSAVFGAVGVLLVTQLGIEISGALAGLVAGLLMALSPLDVQYGQEARPYALLSCLVLIAIWGLVCIAQDPRRAGMRFNRPEALRWPWTAYLLGTIAALLVENDAIPWLAASNTAFAIIVHRERPARGGLLRNWMWVQAIVAVVWLPALTSLFAINHGAVLTGLEWVPKTTVDDIRAVIAAVYMFRISDMMAFRVLPGPLPEFGVAVAILAVVGCWRLKAQPNLLSIIGLAFAAMPITILFLSIFQPLLVPRYLLWSEGPYFVMAGIGAAALPVRLSPAIAATVAAAGLITLWPYYTAETKSRWDQAAAYLASNARPQDVIVTEFTSTETMIRFYGQPFHFQTKFDVLAWRAHRSPLQVADAEHRWIVYGPVGQSALESEQEFRTKWSALGAPSLQARFGTHILILRFDRMSPPSPLRGSNGVQLDPKS